MIYFLSFSHKVTENAESPGFFLGFVDTVGDKWTFKILKNYLVIEVLLEPQNKDTDNQNFFKRI
jgi:hypothetical protein